MAKRTYNNELNPISYIHRIPFIFLSFRGRSANFRIGNSKQLVFIPSNYVNKNGTIKDNVNLDWWFYKHTNQHKIKLYKEENMKKEESQRQKEVINRAIEYLETKRIREKAIIDIDVLEGILKEVSE